jgi:hypothetical protein
MSHGSMDKFSSFLHNIYNFKTSSRASQHYTHQCLQKIGKHDLTTAHNHRNWSTQSQHSTTTLFHALAALHTSAMQQYTTSIPSFHNDDLQSPFYDLQQLDSIQQFESLCQRVSAAPPLHAQHESSNDSLLFTAYSSRLQAFPDGNTLPYTLF